LFDELSGRMLAISEGVSVIGLGKLGACVAACLAHKGFRVIGVDVNQTAVNLVNAGKAPIGEPGLNEMIAANQQRLRATTDYTEAISASDVTLIVVPTPSDDDGAFSLAYVRDAGRKIGSALREHGRYHLVVLTSTVLPGSTENDLMPLLEAESGKACGADFGLCYSPEFVALGSVIRDFLRPDLILIGESDERAGAALAAFYGRACDNRPPVARMSFMNAELTKLSVNTYVTMKISFANMLAAICERLPGGDVDVVTSALALDPRIGSRYLKGAVSYGGPCFPRDNKALAYLGRQLERPATLAEATDSYNRAVIDRVLTTVEDAIGPNDEVAVLGLAYKPNTGVVDEAAGLLLAGQLADRGFRVTVHDPLAIAAASRVLGTRVRYAATPAEAIASATLVALMSPDPTYTQNDVLVNALNTGTVLLDAWRSLPQERIERLGVRYIGIGRGQPSDKADLARRL
jgi:UDPglucose 6-dehydrogenase